MDEEHEETRQRIRKIHTGSSSDHIVAGLKGFGFGLLGGATSIFKQTYEGACNEGFQVNTIHRLSSPQATPVKCSIRHS
jgi:vacuolar protein sorting-associated protein 13D